MHVYQHVACAVLPQLVVHKLVLVSDNKTRPKREPLPGGRPGSTAPRDSTFGRVEREAPRRDRALRDSWQSSSALGSPASSTYRPAPVGRGSRAAPDRLSSDNSRGSLDNGRESFAPSSSNSSSSRGVFRTQSGPPLRDREDFGFGSASGSYNDSPGFKPAAARGLPLTGRVQAEKVHYIVGLLGHHYNTCRPTLYWLLHTVHGMHGCIITRVSVPIWGGTELVNLVMQPGIMMLAAQGSGFRPDRKASISRLATVATNQVFQRYPHAKHLAAKS